MSGSDSNRQPATPASNTTGKLEVGPRMSLCAPGPDRGRLRAAPALRGEHGSLQGSRGLAAPHTLTRWDPLRLRSAIAPSPRTCPKTSW